GAGCDRRKAGADMPAAQDWQGSLTPDDPHAGVMAPGGGGPSDPHAGLDMPAMGSDPSDPHAGLDMGGGGGDEPNPHAGMGGGPVDPATALIGTVDATDATRSRMAAGSGAVLFLSVRQADAAGNPIGGPLAVDVMPGDHFPAEFTLSAANAMGQAPTALAGNVVVMARWDQDHDASTKQAGDVTGQVVATVPASGLTLQLDTVLP
ncbi:MAG: hypothetical protein KC464_25795, partial [Myxococcales bacterium]|nr:hypothetical protein [Myxococcales bacterium]